MKQKLIKSKEKYLRFVSKAIFILFVIFCLGFGYFQFAIVPKIENTVSTLPDSVKKLVLTHKSTYVPLADVSPFVNEAAVASQDEGFYSNSGIDYRANFRAILFTIIFGKRQGASTITEQLAKNVFYKNVDNLRTDLQTKALAIYITRNYHKDQVLEYYLNVIYFGKNSYGIGSASENYFKVSPKELTLGQSAYLISLINSPSYYSSHLPGALDQTHLVLDSMASDHFISETQEETAYKEIVNYFKVTVPK